MKRNEIEERIRERFLHMEEEVDVQKIMAGLPSAVQESRKYSLFWLLGSSAGVILLAGLSFYFIANSQNHDSASLLVDNTEELQALQENDLFQTNTIKSFGKSSTMISSSIEDGTALKSELIYNDKQTYETQQRRASELELNNTVKLSYTKANVQGSSRNPISSGGSSYSKEFDSKTTIGQSKEVLAELADGKLNEGNIISDLNAETRAESPQGERFFETNTIDQLKISELDAYLFVKTSIFTPVLPKKVDCPTFGSNPWEFELGSSIGISNPSKSLAPKNNENIPAYPSRAINEKSLEGLDLELFLSAKRARWPVFLKSGVNYSRWSERMRIDESYSEIDTVQGIISTTVSQSGDTITYIYGDIFVERDYQIKKSIHYFLHRFDIPLSVVYEGYIAHNQSIQAEIGTRVNFSTLARGRIYNNNLEFSNASLPAFFRRFSGLSYFTKLHYRYYLSERQFIGASAYFQHLPADFSTSSNQIEQRYLNYGLGVYYGMRF